MAMHALATIAAAAAAGALAYALAGRPFSRLTRARRIAKDAARRERMEARRRREPLAARVGAAIEAVLPISLPAARDVQGRLDEAGLALSPQSWRGAQAMAAVTPAALLAALLAAFGPLASVLGAVMGAIAGWAGSGLWLESRANSRGAQIDRAMPQALELLRITVEAGAVPERGFRQLSEMEQLGELAREFARVDFEVSRLGATRVQALEAMRRRCRSKLVGYFVSAMVSASERGASIAGVLQSQARLALREREQQLEAEANKLSVKVTFPLVLCFLPAALIVALAPQMATLMELVEQLAGAV